MRLPTKRMGKRAKIDPWGVRSIVERASKIKIQRLGDKVLLMGVASEENAMVIPVAKARAMAKAVRELAVTAVAAADRLDAAARGRDESGRPSR